MPTDKFQTLSMAKEHPSLDEPTVPSFSKGHPEEIRVARQPILQDV
jgi:hypothetical protein